METKKQVTVLTSPGGTRACGTVCRSIDPLQAPRYEPNLFVVSKRNCTALCGLLFHVQGSTKQVLGVLLIVRGCMVFLSVSILPL